MLPSEDHGRAKGKAEDSLENVKTTKEAKKYDIVETHCLISCTNKPV